MTIKIYMYIISRGNPDNYANGPSTYPHKLILNYDWTQEKREIEEKDRTRLDSTVTSDCPPLGS